MKKKKKKRQVKIIWNKIQNLLPFLSPGDTWSLWEEIALFSLKA